LGSQGEGEGLSKKKRGPSIGKGGPRVHHKKETQRKSENEVAPGVTTIRGTPKGRQRD